jgi:hypothetical protein
MSQVPDTEASAPPTLQDAERACEELHDQIERARKVLRDYRDSLGEGLSDNDNRAKLRFTP